MPYTGIRPPGSVIPRGSKWIARWTVRDEHGRHQKSKTFPTEAAAWLCLRQVEEDKKNAIRRAEQRIRARAAEAELTRFPDDFGLYGPFEEDVTYAVSRLPWRLRQALAPHMAPDDQEVERVLALFETVCAELVKMVAVNIAAVETAAESIVAIEEGIAAGLDKMVAASLKSVLADPRGSFVYCLWGDDRDRPLYVGKSTRILCRLGAHFSTRGKADLIRRVTLVRCQTVTQMDDTERRLIRRHQPPWNTVGIHRTEWEERMSTFEPPTLGG